jgi:hypothetical protein
MASAHYTVVRQWLVRQDAVKKPKKFGLENFQENFGNLGRNA